MPTDLRRQLALLFPFRISGMVGLARSRLILKGAGYFTLDKQHRTRNSLPSFAMPMAPWARRPHTPVDLGAQKCNSNIDASHIAIDPQGKNLFISCNASGTATFNGIQVYGINQTTGALSRVDSFTTAHSFEALSSDRQGWRVFAATEESNLVEPFDFDRTVSQVGLLNGGILYHTGSQPNGVAIDPSNKFLLRN